MTNELFGVNIILEVASCMKNISVLLITVPLLLSPVAAVANNGVITFHGQVTNPGCAVQISTDSTVKQNVRYVKVSDRLTLKVETSADVCGRQEVLFSTRYEALPANAAQVNTHETNVVGGGAGIVTLTYQ